MTGTQPRPRKTPAAKKPATRKSSLQKGASQKRTSQKQPREEEKMNTQDDDALKQKVLAAALPQAAFDGFTDAVLKKAGVDAGVPEAELARLFENGPVSLVAFYSTWTDDEMVRRLGAMDLKSMKVRERITEAVLARLAALKPNKEAARRAGAFLALPMHMALGAKLGWHTVDAMWRAVGDTSTDFNFYTKRTILAGVFGATAVRWFNDDSADEKPTRDFLAARIENVMQFEAFKAKAKEALSAFPIFADWAKKK